MVTVVFFALLVLDQPIDVAIGPGDESIQTGCDIEDDVSRAVIIATSRNETFVAFVSLLRIWFDWDRIFFLANLGLGKILDLDGIEPVGCPEAEHS